MVQPHLECSNVIWGPFYQAGIRSVETIQRRATKLIPELKDLPYVDQMRNLGIPSLKYGHRRGNMIQMYKIMNGIGRVDNVEKSSNAMHLKLQGKIHFRKRFSMTGIVFRHMS